MREPLSPLAHTTQTVRFSFFHSKTKFQVTDRSPAHKPALLRSLFDEAELCEFRIFFRCSNSLKRVSFVNRDRVENPVRAFVRFATSGRGIECQLVQLVRSAKFVKMLQLGWGRW